MLVCQAAVDATRAGDPYHAVCLNNLGNALHGLARLTADTPALAMPPDAATAARALHHVTRQLRDQYPGQPGLWAAHTHTGP